MHLQSIPRRWLLVAGGLIVAVVVVVGLRAGYLPEIGRFFAAELAPPFPLPQLETLTPASGLVGTKVAMSLANNPNLPGGYRPYTVKFGDDILPTSYNNDYSYNFSVPDVPPGEYDVQLRIEAGCTTVTPTPTSSSRPTRRPRTPILINGEDISRPPEGCVWQEVQCIQAPCDPVLVCSTGTPPPTCVPVPRCVYEGEELCAFDPMPGTRYCPTPTITPACAPRPGCLDSVPQCEIAEPAEGWCPATPTPKPSEVCYGTTLSNSLKFKVTETSCLPRPPCLDASPACDIAEPAEGWCPPAPMLSLYNLTDPERNPAFVAGDRRRLAATGPAGANIDTCNEAYGMTTGCSRGYYSFDSNGLWNQEQAVGGLGERSEWIEVNGVESNRVTYTVQGPPTLHTLHVVGGYRDPNESRNTAFIVGDELTYSALVYPGKSVTLCEVHDNRAPATCTERESEYKDLIGIWKVYKKIESSDVGAWTAWVESDGYKSNLAGYTVSESGISPTPAPGTVELKPDANAVRVKVTPGSEFSVPIMLDTKGLSVTAVKLELRMSAPAEFVSMSPSTQDFPETLKSPEMNQYSASVTVGSGASGGKTGSDLVVGIVRIRVHPLAKNDVISLFVSGAPDSVVTAEGVNGNVLDDGGGVGIPIVSVSAKPGDLDGDGDVDIFDYNLVVSNFGKSGPAGDADGDGDVDIFDYNLVVSNFGK